jgi:hypothetical protein
MAIGCRRQQYKLVMSSCKMSDILARVYRRLEFYRQIFVKVRNVKFREFLPVGAAMIHAQQMDRQTGRWADGLDENKRHLSCYYTNVPKMP